MNKTIFNSAITVFLAIASMQANAQVDKQSEKARKNVKEAHKDVREANENLTDAKHDLQKAKNDSTADYMAFKKEAEADIAANKRTIVELRAKKWNANDNAREKYNRRINLLEKRNNKLQHDINTANHTNSSKWSSFKREFKHDMNELGKAFKDLGVNNAK